MQTTSSNQAGERTQITLTLLDDRNVESVTVWGSFRDAVAHGEEMLGRQDDLGWVGYYAKGEGRELGKVSRKA